MTINICEIIQKQNANNSAGCFPIFEIPLDNPRFGCYNILAAICRIKRKKAGGWPGSD